MAGGHRAGWLALISSLLNLTRALAQPTIVSTVPTDGATGVSTTAAVVFTFSEAMDPTETAATFVSESPPAEYTTSPVWSAGNTVLSCTPRTAFPVSTEIVWVVSGQTPGGTALGGIPEGTFTTSATGGGGGGGGGSGTNQHTAFAIGQASYYDQTSAGAPTLEATFPYLFLADITLASNRTANSVTLELPSTSVSNLIQNPVAPEEFLLSAYNTNQTVLDTTFGNGNYIFTVVATDSNQQVTVNLPASLPQPGVPTLTNYTAAQSVNAAQSFTLAWEPFVGGTATDYVSVAIGSVFSTASPESSNALTGTATSVLIPANTLQPNTNYLSTLGFYHIISTTNKSGYTTAAYRESVTQFNLTTSSGAITPLVLTNASWSGHTISFSVTSAADQSLTIQYNASASLSSNQWKTLLTTNSTTGVVQVKDAVNTTNAHVFYRARSGP
jgi:hypothetical protein